MYKTALEQSDLFKHGTGVVFLINFIFNSHFFWVYMYMKYTDTDENQNKM